MPDHDISQRSACRLVGVDPKTVRRDRPPANRNVRQQMQAIETVRRRFGYHRIDVLLQRKEMIMNHKNPYRLHTDEKLAVRRRRGRKRARGSRTPILVARHFGERRLLDFVSDTFGASRKFHILSMNGNCCRDNPCLMAGTSISGARVARELDVLVRIYAMPACIISDYGTEFSSSAILKQAGENNVDQYYIDPEKPQQNAFIESEKGSPRDELLNEELFHNLDYAR